MKKAILLIALVGISLTTIAQKKTVSAIKNHEAYVAAPSFTVDPQKVYQIPLTLNAEAIYAITLTPDEWAQIKASPKLSGQQITELEKLAADIRKAIITLQQQAIQKDYDAFMSDKIRGKASKIGTDGKGAD
ncbi:hypothetical protein [Mucilaginibacter glaciei]|uniref:Uncharacterized protein n=1 Tax=Mucilaginibacter glaciei TaxID=2772109 RepID=A0A926S2K8_9SPHI|nr:hypothetical protein [Mucilaginibacter glaciei]MBD1394253.1 hypothetical protein [Mucilaginibacter glaciei]